MNKKHSDWYCTGKYGKDELAVEKGLCYFYKTERLSMQRRTHRQLVLPDQVKSFYQLRFLTLLWAVFLSVFISYLTPSPVESAGYQPVFSKAAVKGATTVSRGTSTRVGFYSQVIVSTKFVPTKTPTPTPTPLAKAGSTDGKYSKSRQIGQYTWTIDVPDDDRAGTPQEILQALNAYRQKNGKGSLSWNDKLASFAQSRADLFAGSGKTDSHAGFIDYLNNQDGFTKVGFMKLGENSSLGYKVSATKLIEEVYAGDAPHDTNQLNNDWSAVGIGVNGVATNVIFAGKPL